jgi:hypothetical protein
VEQSSEESTNVSKAKQTSLVTLYNQSFQENGKRKKADRDGADVPDRSTAFFEPGTPQYERQLYVSSHISFALWLFKLNGKDRPSKCEKCLADLTKICQGHNGFTPCVNCMGIKHGCRTNGLQAEEYVAAFVNGVVESYPGKDFLPDNQGLTPAARVEVGLLPLEKKPRRRKTGKERSTLYVNNSNILSCQTTVLGRTRESNRTYWRRLKHCLTMSE